MSPSPQRWCGAPTKSGTCHNPVQPGRLCHIHKGDGQARPGNTNALKHGARTKPGSILAHLTPEEQGWIDDLDTDPIAVLDKLIRARVVSWRRLHADGPPDARGVEALTDVLRRLAGSKASAAAQMAKTAVDLKKAQAEEHESAEIAGWLEEARSIAAQARDADDDE